MPGPLSRTSTTTCAGSGSSPPGGSSSPGTSSRADVDVPLAAERLEGVGQQVGEQLAQLVRVGQQLRHVRRDLRADRDRAAPHLALGHRDRVLQDLVERRALDLQLNRPHELEDLDHDGVGHLGFLDDVVERLEGLRVVEQLALEHAGHHLDARQRVLDLVRDRRGHFAEGRQPVAQPVALFHLLDARQVLEEQRGAHQHARRRRGCGRACSRWRGRSCAAAFRRGLAGRRVSKACCRTWQTSGQSWSTSANGRPRSAGSGVRPEHAVGDVVHGGQVALIG